MKRASNQHRWSERTQALAALCLCGALAAGCSNNSGDKKFLQNNQQVPVDNAQQLLLEQQNREAALRAEAAQRTEAAKKQGETAQQTRTEAFDTANKACEEKYPELWDYASKNLQAVRIRDSRTGKVSDTVVPAIYCNESLIEKYGTDKDSSGRPYCQALADQSVNALKTEQANMEKKVADDNRLNKALETMRLLNNSNRVATTAGPFVGLGGGTAGTSVAGYQPYRQMQNGWGPLARGVQAYPSGGAMLAYGNYLHDMAGSYGLGASGYGGRGGYTDQTVPPLNFCTAVVFWTTQLIDAGQACMERAAAERKNGNVPRADELRVCARDFFEKVGRAVPGNFYNEQIAPQIPVLCQNPTYGRVLTGTCSDVPGGGGGIGNGSGGVAGGRSRQPSWGTVWSDLFGSVNDYGKDTVIGVSNLLKSRMVGVDSMAYGGYYAPAPLTRGSGCGSTCGVAGQGVGGFSSAPTVFVQQP